MNETLSAIFRNEGNFSFSQQHTFPGMSNSSADWLDADNDGDLDLILTGILGNVWGAFDTFLYENTGTGFTEVTTFDVNCAMCAIDIADGYGDVSAKWKKSSRGSRPRKACNTVRPPRPESKTVMGW